MWEPRRDPQSARWVIQHSLFLAVAKTKSRHMAGQRERTFRTKKAAQRAADKMNEAAKCAS